MTHVEEPLYIPLQEAVVSRLMALRQTDNETLPHVINRLANIPLLSKPEKKPTVKKNPNVKKKVKSKYQVHVLGDKYPANSYGEVLTTVFNIIADLDPQMLEKVSKMKGRTRHYIAKNRNGIHKGRPDLNRKNTNEFRPSWFVGTNYSHDDVNRILRGICEASDLEFSKDIKFIKC